MGRVQRRLPESRIQSPGGAQTCAGAAGEARCSLAKQAGPRRGPPGRASPRTLLLCFQMTPFLGRLWLSRLVKTPGQPQSQGHETMGTGPQDPTSSHQPGGHPFTTKACPLPPWNPFGKPLMTALHFFMIVTFHTGQNKRPPGCRSVTIGNPGPVTPSRCQGLGRGLGRGLCVPSWVPSTGATVPSHT